MPQTQYHQTYSHPIAPARFVDQEASISEYLVGDLQITAKMRTGDRKRMDTVFERCGGADGIKRVVTVFYELVLDSPRLRRYFDNTNMEDLHDHQTKFLSWVTEGPVHFSDDSLRQAHEGLGITHSEFLEVVGLLYDALERNDIAAADIDHVVRAFLRREPLIVADDDDTDDPED